jgi:hypothetical protein
MSAHCRKYRCQRVGTCRLADDPKDPSSVISRDDTGTWVEPYPKLGDDSVTKCPLNYEDCDKELKEVSDEKPKAWIKYVAIAAGVLVLLTVLFAMTGEPSEEARREAAAEQLKQIWPWLKTR